MTKYKLVREVEKRNWLRLLCVNLLILFSSFILTGIGFTIREIDVEYWIDFFWIVWFILFFIGSTMWHILDYPNELVEKEEIVELKKVEKVK